ncbi:unnamed protein product, partial [Amoebophrya sp. A120]
KKVRLLEEQPENDAVVRTTVSSSHDKNYTSAPGTTTGSTVVRAGQTPTAGKKSGSTTTRTNATTTSTINKKTKLVFFEPRDGYSSQTTERRENEETQFEHNRDFELPYLCHPLIAEKWLLDEKTRKALFDTRSSTTAAPDHHFQAKYTTQEALAIQTSDGLVPS